MNIEQILKELEYDTGVLPRQALRWAVARKDEITPALLKIIEDAKLLPEEIYDDRYMALVYAIYLLAQFRDKRAYQPIVDFFSIPDEVTLDYTGDIVTEDLNRILASVSRGDASLIKSLVENKQADEYIRSAALRALVTQVACGEATREDITDYFKSLFRGGFTRELSHDWGSLVSCSTHLYPDEVIADIRQAFEEGLVYESYINMDFVEEILARDKESVLKELREDPGNQLITDVAEDIQWWACFHPEARGIPVRSQKVGRNEPCPCGSGKKYKKCCGANI